MGKLGKIPFCVGGAAVSVVAAPIVLPVVAASIRKCNSKFCSRNSCGRGGNSIRKCNSRTAEEVWWLLVLVQQEGTLTAGAGALGVTTMSLGAATVGAGLTYSGMTSIEGFSNNIEADEKIVKAKNIYKILMMS